MIVLPFNCCHDSSRHSPSSSLPASCKDSVGIFKRLSDTAFSFLSRFFQPHFLLIINIRAFVARGKCSAHPEQNSFVYLRFAVFFSFFGRGKEAGSLPTLSHVFHTTDPASSLKFWRSRSRSRSPKLETTRSLFRYLHTATEITPAVCKNVEICDLYFRYYKAR